MRDYAGTPESEVYTLHDLVYRLSLRTMQDMTPRNVSLMTRAIQDTIRNLPAKHDWKYYRRQVRFATSPSVTRTVTAVASSQTVTITSGGNWPADAALGSIYISGREHRVLNRTSNTIITIEPEFAFTADYTGEVVWARKSYRFSREITKVHAAYNLTRNRKVMFISSADWQSEEYRKWSTSTNYLAFQNHGNNFGQTDVIVFPYPTEAEAYEISATTNPIVPRLYLIYGGNATLTANSDTVTLEAGGLTKDLIGKVIRFGKAGVAPVGNNLDQWDIQAFIIDVPSETTLKLSEQITVAGDRGYAISSPIDIDASVMLTYVEDESFAQYTKNHDHKSLPTARAVAKESLVEAIGRDNSRVDIQSVAWDYWPWAPTLRDTVDASV